MKKVSIIITINNAEKSLKTCLESVEKQSYNNIEIIMIDDGSSDASASIAKEWCEKDKRFKLLVNDNYQGLSYSRNRGIDYAEGEYIRFVDGSDSIPANSTEKLVDTAQKHNSDLVIGILQKKEDNKKKRLENTVLLAEQIEISPYDESLCKSFYIFNALFSKKIIDDNCLSFALDNLACDYLFLFTFIKSARAVNGCNAVVYDIFTNDDLSSCSDTTYQRLKDYIESIYKIMYMCYDAPKSFHDGLVMHLIESLLIQDYYSRLWHIDYDTLGLLMDSFDRFWKRLPEKHKKTIRKAYKKYHIINSLPSRREIVDKPALAIVVSNKLSAYHLKRLMNSIYLQNSVSFVVYVEERTWEKTSEILSQFDNVIVCSEQENHFYDAVYDSCTAKGILFIEDDITLAKDSIENAQKIMSKGVDFVSGYIAFSKSKSPEIYNLYRYMFFGNQTDDQKAFDKLDCMISNKIFSVDYLRNSKIHFSDNRSEDMKSIYSGANHLRVSNIVFRFDKAFTPDEFFKLADEKIYTNYRILEDSDISTENNYTEKLLDSIHFSVLHPTRKKILFVPDQGALTGAIKSIYNKINRPKAIAPSSIWEMNIAERMAIYNQYRMIVFQGADTELDRSRLPQDQVRFCLINTFVINDDEADRMLAYLQKKYVKLKAGIDFGIISSIKRKIKSIYNNKSFYKKLFITVSNAIRKTRPIDEKAVLFISDMRNEMGGSLEYIYQQLPEGYKAFFYFSKKKWRLNSIKEFLWLIYHMTRCKYIMLEDFFEPMEYMKVRRGQEICQLWHGEGAFKRFAHGRYQKGDKISIHSGYKKYTKAIVSAPTLRHIFANAFQINVDCVQATGIPRTDLFFNNEEVKKRKVEIFKSYPELIGKKIILFAPTYRGKTLQRATYDFSKIDFDNLRQVLGNSYICLVAWHPAVYNNIEEGRVIPPDLKRYNGFVIDITKQFDTNDQMLIADIMVTDYSSIIFNYSLLNKPIVFYAYDMDEYTGGRGFYYNFEKYIYGELVTRKEELAEAIKSAKVNENALVDFKKHFMQSCDGYSSQRTADFVFRNIIPSKEKTPIHFSVIYYSDRREDTLQDSNTLRSLIALNYDKCQIQLITAGLNADIIREASLVFDNTIIVNKKKSETVPQMLNRCINLVEGEVVVFVKDGDQWEADSFKNAYSFIKKNKATADIYVCNTTYITDAINSERYIPIQKKSSRIINLDKSYRINNQIAGNWFVIASEINGTSFCEDLTVGYMQLFYNEIALQKLSIGYIKESSFATTDNNAISERRGIANSAAGYSDYMKSYHQRLKDEAIVLYGYVPKYIQNVIVQDLSVGVPDYTVAESPMEDKISLEYTLKMLVADIDKSIIGDLQFNNPEFMDYLNSVKKHYKLYGKKDYANSEGNSNNLSLCDYIERENFKILVINAIERKIRIEGTFASKIINDGLDSELYIINKEGEEIKIPQKQENRRKIKDCCGNIISILYDFSIDLSGSQYEEYSFATRIGNERNYIEPNYGEYSGLSHYIDETRVRNSDIIIKRHAYGFAVVEPSENMKLIISAEKTDTQLYDVVTFFTVRGNTLQENLDLVYDSIKTDVPTRVFSAMKPYDYWQLSRARDAINHSRVLVTDDYVWLYRNREKPAGQFLIQLWHACGAFKKFGIDGTNMFPGVDALTHQYYDLVSVSADSMCSVYAHAFKIPIEKVKALGIPRTDLFFDDIKKEKLRNNVYKKHPELKEKEIILYAPTFRDGTGKKRNTFTPDIDFKKLSLSLHDNQLFVICPHPVMTATILKQAYSNILELRDVTTLEVMMIADLLITDYSSVIFEFSLLRKPIAFFCYDYEEYNRDFYLDYENDLPGPLLRTQKELTTYIRHRNFHVSKEYDAFIEKYMSACDGHSTERITAYIKDVFRQEQRESILNNKEYC